MPCASVSANTEIDLDVRTRLGGELLGEHRVGRPPRHPAAVRATRSAVKATALAARLPLNRPFAIVFCAVAGKSVLP